VVVKLGRKAVRKALAFSNPYDVPKTFYIETSDASVLKVLTPTFFLEPLAASDIELSFAPRELSHGTGAANAFLFVTDEVGQTQQCLQFNVAYAAQ